MKQIERILAEIHRLKNELEGYSAQEVLDYIESYINIISREQPSSSDLDEAAQKVITMKYIDAERLREELENSIRCYYDFGISTPSEGGELNAYEDILAFLDFLQQEQPSSSDLDEAAEEFGKRQGLELAPFAQDFFKVGAKWAAERIKEGKQ